MMQRGNASMMMGASSWKDQFMEAFTVQAGKTHVTIAAACAHPAVKSGESGAIFSTFPSSSHHFPIVVMCLNRRW